MEKRTCTFCNETFELTSENFYHSTKNGKKYYHNKCKECYNYENRIKYLEKKMIQQQEAKDEWKKQFFDQIFVCKICREEKTGREMKLDSTNKRMDKRCRDCYNKVHREKYAKNYRANVFGKVMEKQRSNKNDN